MNVEDLLVKHFSRPDELKEYSKVLLWDAEKYFLNKYFKTKGKILDIGCGAGRVSIPLAKKGFTVTGIDLTPKMIEQAQLNAEKHKVNADFKVMNVKKLLFQDNSFDYVLLANCTLCQIPGENNRLKVLKEAYRVLKDNGYLLLSIHSLLSPEFKKRLSEMKDCKEYGDLIIKKREGDKTFLHLINPNKLLKTTEKIGLKLIENKAINFSNNKLGIKDYKPTERTLILLFKKH